MATRAPLTRAEKQIIYQKKASGHSLAEICQEIHCAYETVRKWWRIERDQCQVRRRGRPQQGPLSTFPLNIREQAIQLKQAHPHWGPKRILLELEKVPSLGAADLPSPARLSVLFKQRCPEAVQPRHRHLLPPPNPQVFHVHQRWQMDAKEGLRIGNERVNIQEIRDCYSALMITSQAFVTTTLSGYRRLTCAEHQQVLRQAFCRWGLPLEVQTDNDGELVNPTDPTFPSPFTLWLVGLGITHITSRPHRPTDQSQVERHHRTQGDFVWKDQSFEQLAPLQRALDEQCQLYNRQYPSQAAHCQGSPPLSVFPSATRTGRPYHYDLEWELFDLNRVDAFLSKWVWTRTVATNGTVHLGGFYYILGKAWVGQTVSICFLPEARSFRFENAEGEEIAICRAQGIEKDQLIGTFSAHLPLPAGFQFALFLPGV